MAIFSDDLRLNADADVSFSNVDGAAIQRVWNISVPPGELKRCGTWYYNEGAIGLLIQVSSIQSGNSGTTQYFLQSGFSGGGDASSQNGSWHRLLPFNVGVGHGVGPDTGRNTNSFRVYIGGASVQGNYTKELGIYNGNSVTFAMRVTVTELSRGLTFTDNSALANIPNASLTVSDPIYSVNEMGIGRELFIGNNGIQNGSTASVEGSWGAGARNGIVTYLESPIDGRSGIGIGCNKEPIIVNRLQTDGTLIRLRQDGNTEGEITVNGGTVSYGGGHLSRWSQLPGLSNTDTEARPTIYPGTLMSNLDEMCEWVGEDNDQLNKTQVSNIEGDPNVTGIFTMWDESDDTGEYLNDFWIAMTGDLYIRIGSETTVARGDLLMSAGDGTAKPQGDDIVRSKTIAKVTSTYRTREYPDGSYCVPCTLMAC